ncbi:MAG: FGGY-family carbohydrate kinase [Bacteroidales bacterium]|nr:FGGY-family carbohydrate kinase [Bacteroidales bacterium]
MNFFLGIDLGTSYFKAGIFDTQGKLVGLGRSAVKKQTGNGAICELPIVEFWDTLKDSVNQAILKAGINPSEILSISYSSQANSFVLLDENNTPLTPLILWPDERAGKIPISLEKLIERDDFQQKTGLGILPGIQSIPTKLIWFQEHQPKTWRKVKSIMSISDYLTYFLTGHKLSDFSTASMTGLFDVCEEKWWDEALKVTGIGNDLLSNPKRTGSFVDVLTEKGANQLGLSKNTKFFLGGLDHHMVATGADLLNSGNISESTGTVLACVNYKNGYEPQNGINIAPGLTKGYYFQMAFNENGATALEWYQKNFAPRLSLDELLEMAENVSPGCDGLEAIPSTDKYGDLSGFRNIKKEHTHGHFIRAILESTSQSLRDLINNKLEAKNLSGNVVSSGGGARSHLWIQIKADMLNRRFILPKCSELACQGAALVGATGMMQNQINKMSSKNEESLIRIFTPNSVNVEKYKKLKCK